MSTSPRLSVVVSLRIHRPTWREGRWEADSNDVQMLTIGQVTTLILINEI